jgi:hypothetical protein
MITFAAVFLLKIAAKVCSNGAIPIADSTAMLARFLRSNDICPDEVDEWYVRRATEFSCSREK